MEFPLISCIVPVFNGEKYLAEALESVLKQPHRPLEIIVVDDGSTDGTPSVAARFGVDVRYVKQSNAGPSKARNYGLGIARGEFVAFIDADDLWDSEKLKRQLSRFVARPELSYCVGHVQNFWIPELCQERDSYRDHRVSKALPGYVSGTLLARHNLFETVGPFDESLAHGDAMEWFLRANQSGAISELLPDVLLYRRIHRENRSRQLASQSREEFLRLVKNSLDRRRSSDGKC